MTWPARSDRAAQFIVESPTEALPSVRRRVAEFVEQAHWNLYPADSDRITARLASMWGVDSSSIRLGSGSSATLRDLVSATLLAGGSFAYPGATFPGYVNHLPERARTQHSHSLYDYGHDSHCAQLADWLGRASPTMPKLCVVCAPGSPLPKSLNHELTRLSALLDTHHDLHVAIDTAYCEWEELPRIFESIRNFTNPRRCSVVVSTSKTLGLAGLRLGAGVIGQATARDIGFGSLRFPVSQIQLVAWEALLDDLSAGRSTGRDAPDALHLQIRNYLQRLGIPILGEARGLYITVPAENATQIDHLRCKVIMQADVVRVRVDAENAAASQSSF